MPKSSSDRSHRLGFRGSLLTATSGLLILILGVTGPLHADKVFREKPQKGQAGATFTNATGETVHGLKIQLNNKAAVVTDAETNWAGPFRDIKGNGTKTLELSNPQTPITPDFEPFDLAFRSYKSGLKITKYWWLDGEGKQVGEKQTP